MSVGGILQNSLAQPHARSCGVTQMAFYESRLALFVYDNSGGGGGVFACSHAVSSVLPSPAPDHPRASPRAPSTRLTWFHERPASDVPCVSLFE